MRSDAVRELVTPEGVALRFPTALLGDRLAAFALDACVIIGGTLAVVVLTVQLALVARGVALAMGLVAAFLIRCFYFPFFECRWQGRTPGKRVVGIRVVDGGGGVLTAEAVLARNLTREVELFLPLTALLAPQALLPEMPAWGRYASLGWLFVMALMPLFNQDRLRVGDLIGGTLVVRSPEVRLRDDLSAGTSAEGAIAFTTEQLDLYGIRELHVLEGLLRQPQTPRSTLEAVAQAICRKIAWTAPSGSSEPDAERFLRSFYDAQRARLEQRLQLGERREAKRSGRLSRTP